MERISPTFSTHHPRADMAGSQADVDGRLFLVAREDPDVDTGVAQLAHGHWHPLLQPWWEKRDGEGGVGRDEFELDNSPPPKNTTHMSSTAVMPRNSRFVSSSS